jgi:hypothetical protein
MVALELERQCGACDTRQPSTAFSKTQWAAGAGRRCKACVDAGQTTPTTSPPPTPSTPQTLLPATTIYCDNAGCDKPALSSCGRCRRSWYCGRDCQREHWKRGHKALCSPQLDDDGASPAMRAWREATLRPFLAAPGHREAAGLWVFDRRVDVGAVAGGETAEARAFAGANLLRELVLFVDLAAFGTRGAESLWFSDLKGLRFAAKAARRRKSSDAREDAAARHFKAATDAYAAAAKHRVGLCYLGFAAVVSDSAAVVDGAAPEAVVFVDWPESAIVKWQAELAQGDAVDVACPPAPPAKVTVKSFDPLA